MIIMLKGLSDKLRSAIDKISRMGVIDKEAVEDVLRDVQRALFSADVDVQLVSELSENVRKTAFEKLPEGMSRREHIIKTIYDELTKVLGGEKSTVSLTPKKILLVGLYGSGKTSTAAKLGRFYQKKGLKVALICCDTYRPAAFEQLMQLAKKIDVPFYGEKDEKSSSRIARNAMKHIRADVIIVDSSGRNALDESLVEEIKNLNNELQADERILVIPADIGQATKQQAAAFHKALGITDVIVTKLDATAKGGGALTACYETGAKVKFITVGETPEDLEHYDPQKFAARLLGFPDLETLLEKAKASVDVSKTEKIIKGDFDIEDFYSQVEGMQKMGPMTQILEMAGLGKLAGRAKNLDQQADKMKKWKYIIQGMTREEKSNPDVINSSRIRRIAKGSGVSEHDVRELIAAYSKVKKMIKQISPAKLKRGGFGNLFRQFGMG
jgi:signal recognition particle subunit SRP54